MNKEKLLCRKKIEQAFKMFDINGDGYIDHGELSKVVGGVAVDEKQWKEIIAEIDTDGDGMVTFRFELNF
jgi:calcium-dependent protein kinase